MPETTFSRASQNNDQVTLLKEMSAQISDNVKTQCKAIEDILIAQIEARRKVLEDAIYLQKEIICVLRAEVKTTSRS
jgi:hypothetical protein